ncbi:Gfo/Idh/MocA family protein [Thalassotalea profundi]|uniref:Gfo/Idh/MocA family protein n=1 Tax=Thalassotalea profundi TaxID=2036687 RepID=UPI00357131A6
MDKRKLRMAMVGGGHGAFIGAVHRIAAQIDGQISLCAGAFSQDAQRSIDSGISLFLPEDRCYRSYQELITCEAKKPLDQRIDFIAIVTPNHLHFDIAKMALEHGFHVLSDKPATFNLNQALALKKIIEKTNQLYALSHAYTGYPLVKHAKNLVNENVLGNINKIVVEYSQGWLAPSEDDTSKQASWRLDPKQSGISCCMGDIGVHAANLAEYISGLEITRVCADLAPVVEGRQLDDDGTVLLRFNNGAKGVLMASQISTGEENDLRIRIYGDKASIDWSQLAPNTLWLKINHQSAQMIRTGVGHFSDNVIKAVRTPAGHPEGYLEAFANIYSNFAEQIRAFNKNHTVSNTQFDVPGIDEAIRGMAFIENVVRSNQTESKWSTFTI